jgi:hypothetical protein
MLRPERENVGRLEWHPSYLYNQNSINGYYTGPFMMKTSRTPRLDVAERKNLRKRKAVTRSSSTPPPSQRSPAVDQRDAAGLRRVLAEANIGRRGQRERINSATLANFARPLGGSPHRQQWDKYLNGTRAIPLACMLIVCVMFPRNRPQDIFPSWRFPKLTQLPPESPLTLLIHCVMTAMNSRQMATYECASLTKVVELYVTASPHQRESILRSSRQAVMSVAGR